ncbi:hypothetical protein [Solirubrobacter soli]|uniref:hypothetical protein n=1 Tax=Solirubrobacter soli TaxID=363832 RepID=UPI00069F7651|nr:hypothetical protein [Solirubrobacter soli]
MRLALALLALLVLAAPAQAQEVPARVQGDKIVLTQGKTPSFWAGVNLGATLPGHAPGELAPSRADYDRWLTGIGDLDAKVVRVYTILRPAFYDALAAYNQRHPNAPLHFIQGVWIPEEEFLATQNAYDPSVTNGFDAEIEDAVKVVHGGVTLPKRPGHASGTYRSDVSKWLLAWSPGIEWDPAAASATDAKNAGTPPYAGRYVTATPDATPMESWLAARLDHLATLEAARGWSRPLTFTNWITADPLPHPLEPFGDEDRVSIDAMHLQATAAWAGGFFASYHAYPYYPDFLRLEYRGAADPYAAYLQQLRAHHAGQAVMVTEFGVPSGIGVAHRGPLGRDQGDHSEQQAGKIDASMLRVIESNGFAGGLLFEYTDEWFKRSWNTQDLAIPIDRRPLWHNVLTNETQFGLVATEPGKQELVTLDGRTKEWRGKTIQHDAAYLYLRAPGAKEVTIDGDVTLTLGRKPQLRWATKMDPMPSVFGLPAGTGAWVSPRFILSRPFTAGGVDHPVDFLDLGTLRRGSERADARNLVDGAEIRLPWMLLGYADPSAHLKFVAQADGTVKTRTAGPLKITIDGKRYSYRFPKWNSVQWHERRKAGWNTVRAAFRAASR